MFLAFLRKDFLVLRYRVRSFVMAALAIVVMLGVLAVDGNGTGASIFGADFIRLAVLSLVGLAAFLEYYTGSLAADKRDGILAMVILNRLGMVTYFAVKVVVPRAIALLASVITVCAYLLFVSPTGFAVQSLLSFLAVIGSEIFLSMGLGMWLNAITSVNVRDNPGIALPFVFINLPLLYVINPLVHLALFVLVTMLLGLVCYAISAVILARRFRNNLSAQ